MSRRLRVAPEAETELAEAALWYEAKRAGLGVELVAAVDEALDAIQVRPQSFPIWRTDMPFRKGEVRRFPFLVFYVASEGEVTVFAFAHAKRRPGYWLDR